jgi:hypothetical protein
MADVCQDLEQLAPGEATSEMARAQPMVAQLRDLLEQVAEQVMHNTACAADD